MRRLAVIFGLSVSMWAGAGVQQLPARAQASVTPYPKLPDLPLSSTYRVLVNGSNVPVNLYQGQAFAWFAVSGQAHVTVVVNETVRSHQLSPKRLGIPTTVNGQTISFTFTGRHTLVVRKVNALLEELVLFADAPERQPPQPGAPGVFNVQRFGAHPNGNGNAAPAIQHAIDAASAYATGGVAYVPAGTYNVTSPVFLKSKTNLYLAPGAVIRILPGSYPTVPFPIRDTVDASVSGRGVLYGAGSNVTAAQVQTHNNINLHLHDIMLLAAPSTFLRFGYEVNSGVHNVKVLAGGPRLADGIDFDGVFNFIVEDSFVWSTDDNVAVGSGTDLLNYRRPVNTDTLIIRNNVFRQTTQGHVLSVVPHLPWQYIRNILFEGNDVITAQVGLGVYASDGRVLVSGLTFRNNRFEEVRSALLDFRSTDFHSWGGCANGFINHESGALRSILLDNNVIDTAPPNTSWIVGRSSTQDIDGVLVNRLQIAARPVTDTSTANIVLGPYVTNVRFSSLASPPAADPGEKPRTTPMPYVDNSVCPGTAGQPLADPLSTLPLSWAAPMGLRPLLAPQPHGR